MKSFTDFLALFWEPIAALVIVGWLIAMMHSAWIKASDAPPEPTPTQSCILDKLKNADRDYFAEWFLDLAQSGSNLTRYEAFALWERFQINDEIVEHQEMLIEKGREAA